MTDWKVVAIGFVVIVVVGTGGLALPVAGQIGAGLLGGFAAGYLAGGTLGNDAWNGLVTGPIPGIVVTPFAALLGSLLGPVDGPLGDPPGGVSVLIVGIMLTPIPTVDGAIAGAAGTWVKD